MDAYTLPTISAPALLQDMDRYTILDVRRRTAAESTGERLDAAVWADPETLHLAHTALKASTPLAVHCAHGHEISAYVTAMALVAGHDARMVVGGFAALKKAGAKTVPLDLGNRGTS